MMGRLLLSLAMLALAGSAWAEAPAECRVAIHLIERDFALSQVTRAIAAKQFNILVVGAGSSLLPGPNGIKNAYPARLEQALGEKLPGVIGQGYHRRSSEAYRGCDGEIDAAGFGCGQARAGGLADRYRGRDAVGRSRSIQSGARSGYKYCPFRGR